MCNALCFGCARTNHQNFNEKLPIIPDKKILQLDVIEKFLNDFVTVTELDFCGTVDDPFMHPQFNGILRLALKCGIKKVWIHTNGGTRSPSYWAETAEILQQFDSHQLKFSIDGLRDTNHLYRQKTNYDRIMANASAFIGAGGNAGWQYLVFPWNKHQVEEASEISKQMGFNTFIHRLDRSMISENNWEIEDVQRIQAEDKQYTKNDYYDLDELFASNKGIENNPIDCYFQNEKMYFIDFNARLWPCCFIRNTEFGGHNTHWHQVNKTMYGEYDSTDWNRLDLHSVDDILNHPFYKQDLVKSFDSEYGTSCGSKMVKCASTCSKKAQEARPIAKFKIERHNN
jgi:MoaA/NifB/PqqE/SkfB family radical SAM enzyme